MTTMADLVADTRRMAYGSMAEQINLVETAAVAGETTLVLELDVSGISTGTLLSSGMNVWFVKGVNTSTREVLVVPAYGGAPEAAVSVGDIVYIKPRVTDYYLFSTLCDVIRQMSSPASGLYKLGTWIATVDPTWQTYDIPVGDQEYTSLIGARALLPGSTDSWIDIPRKAIVEDRSSNTIRLLRNIPTSSSVEFRYKGPFTVPTTLADDPIADVGLSDTMIDIPPLGAVATLLRTTEARRLQIQTQGDTRRAGEIPAGSNLSAASAFDRDFKQRIGDEYVRLLNREPIRRDI